MFAFESNCGAVLVNISGISKSMWAGLKDDIKGNFKNNEKCYLNMCLDFVIDYGIPKVLKSGHSTNIIKNLDKCYFLIRPSRGYTDRYVMKTGYNCGSYDKTKSKQTGFYLMGLIVLNEANIISGNMYVIDWVKSFYNNTGSVKVIIDILQDQYKIQLIPADIRLNPTYWGNYLMKHLDICCRDDLIDYIWNYSNRDLNNYYKIAYELDGYEMIFSFDPIRQNEMNTELLYCYILYDY